MKRRRVLIAPLDWGLGHAARCVPVVSALKRLGGEPIIAAEGLALRLLQDEFPDEQFVSLPGYRVRYGRRAPMAWAMLRQMPRLVTTAFAEHRWLQDFVLRAGIDAVISDNRFGLFTHLRPCAYLTHQLTVKSPKWAVGAERVLSGLHRRIAGRYRRCWVPDYPGGDNLSGDLGHPRRPPDNVRYLGPLTRLSRVPGLPVCYDLLAVISGPEPHRTTLENLVLTQADGLGIRALVVRGLPGAGGGASQGSVEVVPHLNAKEMSQAFSQAEVILARPGYSTLMDLDAVGGKAILVPTPGQTEQVYLARRLAHRALVCVVEQSRLNLSRALDQARRLPGFPFRFPSSSDLLIRALEEFLTL